MGVPGHVRSDIGPEFIAKAVQDWIYGGRRQDRYIALGSPWENGYCESFNSKLRDKLLNGEIFYSFQEARIVIEGWRRHYNEARPHSSLGYRPQAPAARFPERPAGQPPPAPPGARPLAQVPTMNQHCAWITRWGPATFRQDSRTAPEVNSAFVP